MNCGVGILPALQRCSGRFLFQRSQTTPKSRVAKAIIAIFFAMILACLAFQLRCCDVFVCDVLVSSSPGGCDAAMVRWLCVRCYLRLSALSAVSPLRWMQCLLCELGVFAVQLRCPPALAAPLRNRGRSFRPGYDDLVMFRPTMFVLLTLIAVPGKGSRQSSTSILPSPFRSSSASAVPF